MLISSSWCRRHLDNEQLAVLYVRNALHGRRPKEPSPESVWAQTVFHSGYYRWPYMLLAMGVMVQTTWEPPSSVAATDSLLALIRTLDVLFLLMVYFDLWLQYRCDGRTVWLSRGWIRAKLLFTVAITINLFVHLALPSAPYALRIFRPFFLIERLHNVRRVAQNIVATAIRIFNVIIMLAIHLLVFSVLGYSLYGGIEFGNCSTSRRTHVPFCSTDSSSGCSDYFSTLENTAMQMFELLTAENFPSVMLPAFECDASAALFFVAFIIIGIFLLYNLTLAVTYSTFKGLMAHEVLGKYGRMFAGFDLAFERLVVASGPGAGGPSRSERVDSLRTVRPRSPNGAETVLGVSKPALQSFFAAFDPKCDAEFIGELFEVWDVDGQGIILKDEFRRLLVNFARLNVRRKLPRRRPAATTTAALNSPAALLPTTSVNSFGGRLAAAGRLMLTATPDCFPRGGSFDHPGKVEMAPVLGSAQSLQNARAAAAAAARGAQARGKPRSYSTIAQAVAIDQDASEELMEVLDMPSPPLPKPSQQSAQAIDASGGPTGAGTQAHAGGGVLVVANPLAIAVAEGVAAQHQAEKNSESTHGACSARRNSDTQTYPSGVPPSGWRAAGIRAMRNTAVTLLFDAVVLINTSAILVELSLDTDDPSSPYGPAVTAMSYVQYGMLLLFVVEVATKLLLWGPVGYWRESPLHRLDLLLVFVALVGTVLEVAGAVDRHTALLMNFLRCAAVSRVLLAFCTMMRLQDRRFIRLVRILRALPGFDLTAWAFTDILPVWLQYAANMICLLYVFAVIGMAAFAGRLTPSDPSVAASPYGEAGFYALNFDTLGGASVCLLVLLVEHDWPVIVSGTTAAIGVGAWVYFLTFWVVCIVMVQHVIVAFLLESFDAQRAKRMALRGMDATGKLRGDSHRYGLENWRALLLRSGRDFSAWHVSRRPHLFDVYDELYRDEVIAAFRDTFLGTRRDRADALAQAASLAMGVAVHS